MGDRGKLIDKRGKNGNERSVEKHKDVSFCTFSAESQYGQKKFPSTDMPDGGWGKKY